MVQVNFPHAWTLQIDTTCSTAVNRRFKEPIPNVQLYMPVIRSSLDLWQYEGVALLQQPVSINLTKRNVKHKV